MKCPICAYADSRVIDSRPTEEGAALRRRRQCDRCGARFTTHERVQCLPLMVVKKDGRREEFNADKLRRGIEKACNKRPVPTDAISTLVQEVETAVRQEGLTEIVSDRIGDMAMERLIHLDQVAYVRFASVYQQFDDVKRFAQLLERIGRRTRRQAQRNGDKETPAKRTIQPGDS
jgi:transcriptional repressor NrdR